MTSEKTILNERGEIIDVPGHILDKVADEAERYFREENERLLGTYRKDAHDIINRLSTHKDVRRPYRRELHREIILKMIGGKKPPADGKATTILFAGPAGSGKSTLRKRFESDEVIDDPDLENARQIYRNSVSSQVAVDFNIFKRDLPEYNRTNTSYKETHGDMYAVIRSEASGLNQAILQFAREQGLTAVREQLMDVNLRDSKELESDAKGNLYVFGVTCAPELSISRVAARENHMKKEEVVRSIQGFSQDHAFGHLTTIAKEAYLFKTDAAYRTIFHSTDGTPILQNEAELHKFKSYTDFTPEKIATAGIGMGRK